MRDIMMRSPSPAAPISALASLCAPTWRMNSSSSPASGVVWISNPRRVMADMPCGLTDAIIMRGRGRVRGRGMMVRGSKS